MGYSHSQETDKKKALPALRFAARDMLAFQVVSVFSLGGSVSLATSLWGTLVLFCQKPDRQSFTASGHASRWNIGFCGRRSPFIRSKVAGSSRTVTTLMLQGRATRKIFRRALFLQGRRDSNPTGPSRSDDPRPSACGGQMAILRKAAGYSSPT
jgi:hypothetical protein